MHRLQERLTFRRNALNLSQAALAEKSGVSQRAIAAYETGASMPTHSRLQLLAKALDVSEAWLMGGGSHEEMTETAIMLGEKMGTVSTRPDLSVLRIEALETMLKTLAEDVSQAEGPRRTLLLDSLDAVLQELRRRAVSTSHEVILHKKQKPRDPSSVLTAEEKAALAAHTSRASGTSSSSGASGPRPGAGGQRAHKESRPHPSSPETKPQRPAHGAKGQT